MPHFFTLHLVLISSSSFFSLALHALALLLHFPPSFPFLPLRLHPSLCQLSFFLFLSPLFTPSPPSLRSDANTFHAMLLPFRLDLFSLPLSLTHIFLPHLLFSSLHPFLLLFFLQLLLLLQFSPCLPSSSSPPSLSLPLLVHQSTLIRYRS